MAYFRKIVIDVPKLLIALQKAKGDTLKKTLVAGASKATEGENAILEAFQNSVRSEMSEPVTLEISSDSDGFLKEVHFQ